MVQAIVTEASRVMTCGEYDCFAIELLQKVKADEADYKQIRDELIVSYRPHQ